MRTRYPYSCVVVRCACSLAISIRARTACVLRRMQGIGNTSALHECITSRRRWRRKRKARSGNCVGRRACCVRTLIRHRPRSPEPFGAIDLIDCAWSPQSAQRPHCPLPPLTATRKLWGGGAIVDWRGTRNSNARRGVAVFYLTVWRVQDFSIAVSSL